MPPKGQKKRALSGNSSSGISPPKTRSKRSPKATKKLSKEHISELELEARAIETDKAIVSEAVRASSSHAPAEMASSNSHEDPKTTGEGADETLVDFDGFTEEDIDANSNDSGKLVSMMKSLMKSIGEVKADNVKLLAGQGTMTQNLTQIQADNVQLRTELNSLKRDHDKLSGDVGKVRQDLNKTEKKVNDTDILVKKHDTALRDQGAAIQRLQEAGPTGEPAVPKDYPYSETVVAQGVYITEDEWWSDNEDVKRKAECIVHKQLGLPGVTVVRSKRQGATDDYAGIVKIKLASEKEAEVVLKNSWRLAENPDPSVNRIYLRPSKPDEKRLEERNFNALIDIVDPERKSVFLDRKTGSIRKKREGGYRGRGGRRGRGRGRGRGSRGARGGRGRGRDQAHYDEAANFDSAWSPSLAPNDRGRGRGRGSSLRGPSPGGSLSSLASMENRDHSPPPFSTFTQGAARNVTEPSTVKPQGHNSGAHVASNTANTVKPPTPTPNIPPGSTGAASNSSNASTPS